MLEDSHAEVLVVGAGPVGQFAALSLARSGVPVEIVDTGVWPCRHSYALALHPASVRLLLETGIPASFIESAFAVREVVLYDETEERARIELGGGDPESWLAVVRQDHLEQALEKALREQGVRIRWRHEVSQLTSHSGGVSARIDKLDRESRGYVVAHTEWVVSKSADLPVQFVVGADGHNSQVRRALGASYPEVGPAKYYAVFEFETDAQLPPEMHLVLGEKTTDVMWPLAGGACRWSFELPEYHDREAEQMKDSLLESGFGYFPTERPKQRQSASDWRQFEILDEAALARLLAERAPWFEGSVENVTWRTVVRFERRLSSSFGAGRLWLAGDSAHITGPAGIQSMNAGLAEAQGLVDGMKAVLQHGAGLEVLGGYDELCQAEWARLHGLTGGLQAQPGADGWIAAHAAELLPSLPACGTALDELAAQLRLAF